jgi:hypothetical protein
MALKHHLANSSLKILKTPQIQTHFRTIQFPIPHEKGKMGNFEIKVLEFRIWFLGN